MRRIKRVPQARPEPSPKQQTIDEEQLRIPTEGFMRLRAVLTVFPVSRSTWWAGISAGRFPKGVKLGPRTTAWKVEDIRKLIERPHAA